MEPREIIKTCSNHYKNWKDEALRARDSSEVKKFLEKAFFWLELQNNLLILWTIDQTMGNDPEVKKKVEIAQENVNRKISKYVRSVLKDLESF